MKALAKAGFTQSYTYFTWRNEKRELEEYMIELTQTEMRHYFVPNFFTNTHDVLPEILQKGGPPAFQMRLVLAATLSPSYGIYSGYELCENAAIPGTEEYLDSEKYEIKHRDWNAPGNIRDYIARINRIRRENRALHEYRNLVFHESSDEHVLCYGKRSFDGSNSVLVAVNLDPFAARESEVRVPLEALGVGPDEPYQVHELISDERQLWRGPVQRIRLDPRREPAAIFRLERFAQRDYGTPCY
jgi:starch synthase (maltosyl-transferring)